MLQTINTTCFSHNGKDLDLLVIQFSIPKGGDQQSNKILQRFDPSYCTECNKLERLPGGYSHIFPI